MTATIHLPDGGTIELHATSNHPRCPRNHSVWIDDNNRAYCIVGQEDEVPYPITIPEPHASRLRVGQKLALARELAGYTPEEFAQVAGMKPLNYLNIEYGRFALTIDKYEALANKLGKTIDLKEL